MEPQDTVNFQMVKTHQTTQIRSVARSAKLLQWVAAETGPRTASRAARAVGLPLATTHHLLNTLAAEGMLAKDAKREYHLGPQVGALADAFQRELFPPEFLLEPLRRLADSSEETAHLSAWRHGEVTILTSVEGKQAVRVARLHIGLEGGVHARASGKLLLALASPEIRSAYLAGHPLERFTDRTMTDRGRLDAQLDLIREQGYAIDEEEFSPGVACVAAPILVNNIPIGAYSLSAPIARFRKGEAQLIDAVISAARAAAHIAPPETPDAAHAA
jgi:IclR family transcriptional regulator, acetate operon repressor